MIKIFVATPTTGNIIDSQSYVLREIEELYKDHVELVYPPVCVRRMFHDYARNLLCEEFLKTDCDILWFLDSDITPSKFVMDLVAIHGDKWKLAGAAYPVFMTPPGSDQQEVVMTAYDKNPESGNLTPARVPTSGSGFIDGLATGCLFIKREVLLAMEKPYFEFTYKQDNRTILEGEDLGFCRKASKLGYKFYTDFSMACRHQKSVDLLDVNNYAISYSNRSVLQYDASIQAIIKEALVAEYQRGFKAAKEQKAPQRTLWVPPTLSR